MHTQHGRDKNENDRSANDGQFSPYVHATAPFAPDVAGELRVGVEDRDRCEALIDHIHFAGGREYPLPQKPPACTRQRLVKHMEQRVGPRPRIGRPACGSEE